jgi:tetratricopeptide (TPR) repeat protein
MGKRETWLAKWWRTKWQQDGGQPRGTTILTTLVIPLASALFILVLFGLWYLFPSGRGTIIELGIIIAYIGVYPLTYLAYLGFREQAQRERIRDDFRLLGLVSEERLEDTVENLYRNVYDASQFVVYIILIVVFALLMLTGYLFPLSTPMTKLVSDETMQLVFFAFLGAYLFSVQELIRRYNTFDLLPQVYSSIFVRMVVAVIITLAGAAVLTATATPAEPPLAASVAAGQAEMSADGGGWAILLAFVIGLFPQSGIRWFVSRVNTFLGSAIEPESRRPLERIVGISPWHQARLLEMGIDDAQNLATVDIRRLLLTTQFDAQEIIHWIDQAILYVKVGDQLDRFRDVKISTFHELRMVVNALAANPAHEPPAKAVVEERNEARKRLTALLALADPDELERLADYSNYPNYFHIEEYYFHAPEVAQRRASIAARLLLGLELSPVAGALRIGGAPRSSESERPKIERDLERALRRRLQNPREPKVHFEIGYALHSLGRVEEALRYYQHALRIKHDFAEAHFGRGAVFLDQNQFEDAVRECTNALNFDSTLALAFNYRGLAYSKLGSFALALADFNKALELNERLADAYLNRGVVYNALVECEKANRDFEIAYLLGSRAPVLWLSWGDTLMVLANKQQATYEAVIHKYSQAILFEQIAPLAYAKRGYVFMQLGNHAEARRNLRVALEKDHNLWDAHSNLGLLEAKERNFAAAIQNYTLALQALNDAKVAGHEAANAASLPDQERVIRYNLAIAYFKLGDIANAIAEFQTIVATAPADSFEAQQATYYLLMLTKSSAPQQPLESINPPPPQPSPQDENAQLQAA